MTDHRNSAVDPRVPRFQATVTTVVLAAVLVSSWWPLLAVQAVLFGLGVAGRSPYGPVWRRLRPALRLAPPTEWEDVRPLAFAQALGLVFALIGLAGTGTVVFPVAVGFALAAAFLNAAFGLCLGCELYLRVLRVTRASNVHP